MGRSLMRWFAAAVVLLTAGTAQAERRVGFPCKGCLLDVPAPGGGPAPLLVVLHGDPPPGSTTPDLPSVAALFPKAAAARGVVVFAPLCPKALGCTLGSWWRWGADPRVWLEAQVAQIEATLPIDADRVFVAGWSGGASYVGWWAGALDGRFAAVAYLGGGMGPGSKSCGACRVPALFVVGDQNEYHHLAVGVRDHYLACGAEVKWELHPKTGHLGEWAAVSAPGAPAKILDWLLTHPRRCPVPASAARALEGPRWVEEAPTGVAAPSARRSPPALSTAGRCACGVPGVRGADPSLGWVALVVAAALRRARR